MLNYEQIKKLARYLRQTSPDIAIAQQDNEVYYSRLHAPDNAPLSHIVNLIQVLNTHGYMGYGTFLKHSYVYHTGKANGMDKGMASMNNIVLKDLDRKAPDRDFDPTEEHRNLKLIEVPDDGRFLPYSQFQMPALTPLSIGAMGGSSQSLDEFNRIYMMTAFALVTHRFVHESSNDANIGAILVSPTGTITACALNTKEYNSTFHAEVNLMQSVYFNNQSVLKNLKGFRIYTTLKPCRMCAAMIHHVGDGAINVIYGQEDNSEDATGTDLDKGSKSKQWLLKESINVGTESEPVLMEEKLHEHRDATKSRAKMWQSLAQDNARNLMLMASIGSLQRELKYLKSIEIDVSVYNHIKAFLKARNVAPKQIARAIVELYGEGFPYGSPNHFTVM